MASKKLTPQQRANMTTWIEALESGQYKQGKHSLRDLEDNYCCMGVACNLFKLPNQEWIKEVRAYALYTKTDTGEYDYMSRGTMPDVICALLDPAINMGELVSMNDLDGRNFLEIAAWLRKEYGIEKN